MFKPVFLFLERFGNVVGRTLMTVIYFVAVMPVAIRSAGSDGVFSAEKYEAGPYSVTDYAQDTVWAGGYFIRWPSGVEVQKSDQDP